MTDQRFLAWVEMNDFILEYEIDDDIPSLPARPWGADALRVAEKYALTQIPTKEQTFDEEHQRLAWRLVRFVGQTFVEAFDGTWVNLPAGGSSPARVAVDLPFRRTFFLEPISLLTAAMKRRTGEEWALVFGYHEKNHQAYRAENNDPAT